MQRQTRNMVRSLSCGKEPTQALTNAKLQLEQLNGELKELRKQKKMLENIMETTVTTPEITPEQTIVPEQ